MASHAPYLHLQLTNHLYFEWFMVCMAIGQSVMLCFDTIYLDYHSSRGQAVFIVDVIFTFFFTMEVREVFSFHCYRCRLSRKH